MARPVLSHRLLLSPEAHVARATPGDVLDDIVARLPVPTARALHA
jgi:MoxR-like ATPase